MQNRKIFIEHVNGLIEQKQKGSCRALFLPDSAYFKHINDAFGHGVGDGPIVSTADVILSVIKKDGRHAGPVGMNSLFVCPKCPAVTLSRIRQECYAKPPISPPKNDIQIYVSIGVALVTDETESFDSMYHKADEARYHVKGHSRNDFAFYEPGMERDDNEVMSDAASISLDSPGKRRKRHAGR